MTCISFMHWFGFTFSTVAYPESFSFIFTFTFFFNVLNAVLPLLVLVRTWVGVYKSVQGKKDLEKFWTKKIAPRKPSFLYFYSKGEPKISIFAPAKKSISTFLAPKDSSVNHWITVKLWCHYLICL